MLTDLLSKDPKNKLDLKENIDSGVYVKDLTSFVVKNATGMKPSTYGIGSTRQVMVVLCMTQRSTMSCRRVRRTAPSAQHS